MSKIKRLYLLVFFVLTACAVPPAQTATSTAVATPSPLDGSWQGQGQTPDGKPFSVSINVQNEHLSGVVYSFTGTDGLKCTGIEYGQINLEQRPQIVDGELSTVLGIDLAVSASFPADQAASGHLKIHWLAHQPRCNGDYEVDWTAAKGTAQALHPISLPRPRLIPFRLLFKSSSLACRMERCWRSTPSA